MPERGDQDGQLLAGALGAEQADRRRLADRLHDGPQQVLVSLGIRLQLLQQRVPDDLGPEVAELGRHVDEARTALRGLMLDLGAPPPDAPLEAGLRWLLETSAAVAGWRTALTVDLGSEVDAAVRLSVQRAVQEALADIRTGADAHRVQVTATEVDGWLEVEVEAEHAAPEHRRAGERAAAAAAVARAEAIGGCGQIDQDGTVRRIRLRVPLQPT